jgi:DNA topoisomerase-1
MARKRISKQGKTVDAADKQLVIVESPAKARTINKYLGPEFVVMASVGHVRDLPTRNPKGVKAAVPGVDVESEFRPTYETIKGKGKTVTALKRAANDAAGVWLATDLDREGEAIAWHLAEALRIRPQEAHRVVFNAITQREIEKAFQQPRRIDMSKVNAQQARRILDRIVGYQVSPLLWKKVAGGLSAGRVQSVALRLVVEREREIDSFVPKEYWRVTGFFTPELDRTAELSAEFQEWLVRVRSEKNGQRGNGWSIRKRNSWLTDHQCLSAELVEVDGTKFEPRDVEAALAAARRAGFVVDERIQEEAPEATGPARHKLRLLGHVRGGPRWRISSVQTKRTRSRPGAPFITSTLQQAASNQLGFTAHTTMRTAQALYEGVPVGDMGSVGLITYMRTDSTHLSPEAIRMARQFIDRECGGEYLPKKANVFATSNKSAQEAHEAIRPTDVDLTPERVRASLSSRQYKLYKLIWERFVACQMSEALWDATTALISGSSQGGELVFRATGRVLVFDGHYKVLGVPSTSHDAVLPPLGKGQALGMFRLEPAQNFTAPPPRYTEASLVKKLESEGIGRPSTYAQIIQVIQDRNYVEKIRNRFYATDLGRVVTDKLMEAFPKIMEIGYTRDMEQKLDEIEEKQHDWVQMLKEFYRPFQSDLEAAYEGLNHAKAETEPAPHRCPECGGGTVYRFGRRGRFLSCAAYPACKYAAPIDRRGNPTSPEQTDVACPKCGAPMVVRKGRYGSFLSCSKYPSCDGLLNLDKKGRISPPKVPPLPTDLPCPKCGASLNLRRGAKGPWLSCSAFPKCRGRQGWARLDPAIKEKWEAALEEHEKAHPLPVIRKLDGNPVGEDLTFLGRPEEGPDERDDATRGT